MNKNIEGLISEFNSFSPKNIDEQKLLIMDRINYGVSYEMVTVADDGTMIRKRFDPTAVNIIETPRAMENL